MAANSAWSVLSRILKGQPAFIGDANSYSAQSSTAEEHGGHASHDPYLQPSGKKVYPDVRVVKTDYHRGGGHAEMHVDIENLSHFEVELDNIRVLGVKTELDTRLQPHTGREFRVYQGHDVRQQPQGKAELQYKIVGNGDYFMHPHDYITRRESDGGYIVTDLRPNTSLIRDV
jgi:hypothetical protein